MKSFSLIGSVASIMLISFFFATEAIAEDDWMKQLEKTLKNQLQVGLFDKFIRYDKVRNMLSFSPALMELAADRTRKSFGNNLQTFNLKPEGNALNFSLALKSGTQLSARIEPEALEVGLEEMAIVGRLPSGIKIEGVDLQKTVSGFFDNLFGSSKSSPVSSEIGIPSKSSSSFKVTDILNNFSVKGNPFRLRRPLNSSILGRSLSSGMMNTFDRKPGITSQRLAMSMENGWLNLNLGDFDPGKILVELTTETLLKQLQGK